MPIGQGQILKVQKLRYKNWLGPWENRSRLPIFLTDPGRSMPLKMIGIIKVAAANKKMAALRLFSAIDL
jgi:hypothetical protein